MLIFTLTYGLWQPQNEHLITPTVSMCKMVKQHYLNMCATKVQHSPTIPVKPSTRTVWCIHSIIQMYAPNRTHRNCICKAMLQGKCSIRNECTSGVPKCNAKIGVIEAQAKSNGCMHNICILCVDFSIGDRDNHLASFLTFHWLHKIPSTERCNIIPCILPGFAALINSIFGKHTRGTHHIWL